MSDKCPKCGSPLATMVDIEGKPMPWSIYECGMVMDYPTQVQTDACRIRELQQQVARLTAERDDWKGEHDRVCDQRDELKAERDRLRAEVTRLRAIIDHGA